MANLPRSDELEGLHNALLDWEITVDEDRQAVVVAAAKLEASLVGRDRVITRLATLLARYGEGHVA